MELTLQEIADQVGGALEGDGAISINGVAGIREARPGEISFLAYNKFEAFVKDTKASALIVPETWSGKAPCSVIRCKDTRRAFYQVIDYFAPPEEQYSEGCSPNAIVHPDATIERNVTIGPGCVVEAGAHIGEGSVLVANVYIGTGSRIGKDCRFYPQVSVREHGTIGDRVWIHNGACIGSEGFGFLPREDGVRIKVTHRGCVSIGNDVEIGANSCIDRARFGVTRVGNGVKIDNLVMIAHNVTIHDHAVIVAQVGIAGGSEIGEGAILAGQSGVASNIHIGAGAIVAAKAGVLQDVAPGEYVSGFPAQPVHKYEEQMAALRKLPEILKRW